MFATDVLYVSVALERGYNAERRGPGYPKVARDLHQPGLILVSQEFQGVKAMSQTVRHLVPYRTLRQRPHRLASHRLIRFRFFRASVD